MSGQTVKPVVSFIAELRVPGYPNGATGSNAEYFTAFSKVTDSLSPKLEKMKGSGLVASADFGDPYLRMSGMGTIDVPANKSQAAEDALKGLDEIKTLSPNNEFSLLRA